MPSSPGRFRSSRTTSGLRLAALRQGQRLAPVGGEADDLEALVQAQRCRGALPHEAVVVDDEDPHGDHDADHPSWRHLAQTPTSGKCVKRASWPMKARTARRIASASSASSGRTVSQRSQRTNSRSTSPAGA